MKSRIHRCTDEGRVAFTDARRTLNLHFLVSGWKRAASLELLGIVGGESRPRKFSILASYAAEFFLGGEEEGGFKTRLGNF